MGRAPCCSKVGLNKGPWTASEDALLIKYIQTHGEGSWRSLPKKAGLLRCGKSCRLRWVNYLRPDIKRGNFTPDEEDLIIRLHSLLGNRWSLIAGRLPGRTDNEIKNYWHSHLSKRFIKHEKSQAKLPTRAPRTNKTNSHEKNQNMLKQTLEENKTSVTQFSIHFPQPVRLSLSSSVLTIGELSSNHHGDSSDKGAAADAETLNPPWSWSCSHLIDSNDLIINGCEDINSMPTNDFMLEKMFEEYQKLLQAEDHTHVDYSFVDSLLS